MEEEILKNSRPDLRELENKVGRKTPESLLVCVRDAADCDDGYRSYVVPGGDRRSDVVPGGDRRSDVVTGGERSFSDKLRNLKQDMKWLRSADVRILRQLLAVHEGIEAMRWLMEEEQDALASLSSSLSGSQSSVVTVEEHRPCRVRPNQTQDLTETNGEDLEDPPPNTAYCGLNHKTYFDRLSPNAEARPPRPPTFDSEVARSMQERHRQASPSLPTKLLNTNLAKSRPQDSDVAPLQGMRPRSDAVRRALIRSSMARGEVDNGVSAQTKQSEETQTQNQTQEGFRTPLNNSMVKEEGEPNRESLLLVYDTQWCWVESLDDVMSL